jgi:hypothetical protein
MRPQLLPDIAGLVYASYSPGRNDSLGTSFATYLDSMDLYTVSIPKSKEPEEVQCPVAGCLTAPSWVHNMHKHFMLHHPNDRICIKEEGDKELPRCKHCAMHIAAQTMGTHFHIKLCEVGRKQRPQGIRSWWLRLQPPISFILMGQ